MKKLFFLIAILFCVNSCRTAPKENGPVRPWPFQNGRHPTSIVNPQHKCIKQRKSNGKPTVIAVIDTGYGPEGATPVKYNAHLCKWGHRDFVGHGTSDRFFTADPVPVDTHGHGTHIAGIIDAFGRAANANYCIVIINYYEAKSNESNNLVNTVKAINWATKIHATYINYSGGGLAPSIEETAAIKRFLNHGGKFIAAAGNENADLAVEHYYPAQDDRRIVVVGNGINQDERAPTSNYGNRVNAWEDGTNVKVYGEVMTGTSQAAAIHTGKLIAGSALSCK